MRQFRPPHNFFVLQNNSIPGWVLRANGLAPAVDLNFAGGLYYGGSLGSLISCSRASTGYAQTRAGALVLFGNNVPRITDLGLLVEESRTNLLLQSQTFTNAAWQAINGSVATSAVSGPDGSTAFGFIPAVGAPGGNALQPASTITVTSGSAYTFFAIVKFNAGLNGGAGYPWIEITTTAGAITRSWFNIQTGAAGTINHTSGSIAALANGFYLISITYTPGATSEKPAISLRSGNGSSGAITGDGVTVGYYVWAEQFELGPFATSYIPTTTVAVTRARDNDTLAGAALAAVQGASGSAMMRIAAMADTRYDKNFLGNGAGGFEFFAASTNTNAYSYNGTNFLNATAPASILLGANFATGFDGSSRSLVVGGGTVTQFIGPSFGARATVSLGETFFNSYVTRLVIWPIRVPDATLQALSR